MASISISNYLARAVKGVVKAAAPKAHVCHCFIKHAITPAERKRVMENLHYSRELGDMRSVMLALAMLGPCSSAKKDGAKPKRMAPPRSITRKCIEQKMRLRGISEKKAIKECHREWLEYLRPRAALPKKHTLEALGMRELRVKKKHMPGARRTRRENDPSLLVPEQIPGWVRGTSGGASGWTARSRGSRGGSRVHQLRSKLWIKGAIKHKGKLRSLLGTPPGQVIPAWIKSEGCKDPRRTYAKALKRIPSAKESREFQKMACLARTLMEIGAKRRVRVRKAA
jgi:hypothetical protein